MLRLLSRTSSSSCSTTPTTSLRLPSHLLRCHHWLDLQFQQHLCPRGPRPRSRPGRGATDTEREGSRDRNSKQRAAKSEHGNGEWMSTWVVASVRVYLLRLIDSGGRLKRRWRRSMLGPNGGGPKHSNPHLTPFRIHHCQRSPTLQMSRQWHW